MGVTLSRKLKTLEGEITTLRAEVELLRKEAARPVTVGLRDAQRLFGISVSKLRYQLQTGQLPKGVAVKDGGQWLIHVVRYEQYLMEDADEQETGGGFCFPKN